MTWLDNGFAVAIYIVVGAIIIGITVAMMDDD